MAGRGPAPKPAETRRRRNTTPATTVLPAGGYTGESPDLPPKGGKRRWTQQTRDWWEVWRRAPQAAEFGPTDWQYLAETAHLVDAFFRGDLSVAAELRLRYAKLGATPEDRLRLRMTVAEHGPAAGGAQAPPSRYGHLRGLPSASAQE